MKRLAAFIICLLIAHSTVSASEALSAVVTSYLEIQAQLAVDKVDAIKAPSAAIASKAAGLGKEGAAVAKAAKSVEGAKDLVAARDAFGALSDAVIAAARAEGFKDLSGVKVAFCPMVKKSWLQKEEQIRNPYFGTAMSSCGEFKK